MKKQATTKRTTQTQTQTKTVRRSTAWKAVDRIFPTDYVRDDAASERAGYPVYRSTASECNAWINDLGARLEVNLPSGETVNIWVDEPAAILAELAAKTPSINDKPILALCRRECFYALGCNDPLHMAHIMATYRDGRYTKELAAAMPYGVTPADVENAARSMWAARKAARKAYKERKTAERAKRDKQDPVGANAKADTVTKSNANNTAFEAAKRDFETAYAAGDYAAQLQTLAQAVAVSVLRKCIDPQRKTAGTLDTVSNSGLSGALLDLRRGIFHDVHALNRVEQAGAAVVLTQYSPDGYITDAILDPDAKAMFDAVVGDTLSDGMDLVQTAAMALLEQAADHAGAAGWVDTPYAVRRPSRKVLIKTDTATYKDETTTPVQEVYRAVRRAIANSRAVQTDPRNGYTYLEVETEDGMDTVYLRTGKYADLGGYTRDGHAADSLPGAPAGYAGGYDPYTADRQTVDDYYAILAKLDLTPRQREILEYRMQGYGYQAIASRLGIRESNVRTVLSRLQVKCAGVGFAPAGYTDTPAD